MVSIKPIIMMNLNLFLICFLSLYSPNSIASTCEKIRGKTLKIGCLYECDFSEKNALREVAREFDIHIHFETITRSFKSSYINGFIIPGGSDISPKYYNIDLPPAITQIINELDYLVEYSNEGRVRDPVEFEFVQRYRTEDEYKNIPLLGLCRGMQMMAVASGIPLYVDLLAELRIDNRWSVYDEITFNEFDSDVYREFNSNQFFAYKYHHQAIRLDYFMSENLEKKTGVKVLATSNQGYIAEIIELIDRPGIGVQFHPELTFQGTVQKNIFNWFLNKACLSKHQALLSP